MRAIDAVVVDREQRVLIEDLRLELQQVYYSFHRPGVREGLRPADFQDGSG